MIYFEEEVINKIKYEMEKNSQRELFVIGNNNYYIVNSYSELRELNLKYKSINIVKEKIEEERFKKESESILTDEFIVINFNVDLKLLKEEMKSIEKYIYCEKCIFMKSIENNTDFTKDISFEDGGLILDYCLIIGEVNFTFDPIYLEANMSRFMNEIDIHDLTESFRGSHSQYKGIKIETCSIEDIYLDFCSGEYIDIKFDYHEPNLDIVEIKYSDFKFFNINSNKSARKIKNKETILTECKIKEMKIYKLYAEKVTINHTEIENIIMDKSIINEQFIFTDYLFETISLVETYFTGKILFDLSFIEDKNIKKVFSHNVTDEELIYNLDSFLRIAQNEDNPDIKLKLKYLRDVQKNKVNNNGVNYYLNRILDLTTGYFTNYKRIVLTMVSIIILFGIVYSFYPENIIIDNIPLNISAENNYLLILYNSIYFSLITFTTIVYGNISPIGGLKMLAGIEGLLGVLTSASLVTVFARKFS